MAETFIGYDSYTGYSGHQERIALLKSGENYMKKKRDMHSRSHDVRRSQEIETRLSTDYRVSTRMLVSHFPKARMAAGLRHHHMGIPYARGRNASFFLFAPAGLHCMDSVVTGVTGVIGCWVWYGWTHTEEGLLDREEDDCIVF
jgi:hypothetical protein